MRAAFLFLSFSIAGCGGKVVEQVGGAAGTSDVSSATTTVATTTASSSSTGLSCKELRGEIRGAESRAKICLDPDGPPECTVAVDGICCRVTVNPANIGWVELHAELMEELRRRPECAPDADYCFMDCHPQGPGECLWDSRGAAECYP